MTLMEVYEKCKKLDPKIWIASYVLISAVLLYFYPKMQVSHFEINNSTTVATLENQYRATLTQILGGAAVAIGIYFAWKNFITAQENLKTAQEGQITERFTRAVDQLGAVDKDGNPAIEIRLGGIYALERIANESDKDYWPIMEILTAYIRKNSIAETIENKKIMHFSMDIQAEESNKIRTQKVKKLPLDIQAVLTVIGRRKYYFGAGESKNLNLSETCLQGARLSEYHLERVNLNNANLINAVLSKTNLKQATFSETRLENAHFREAYLENAVFINTHLENADLNRAHLEDALFIKAYIEDTVFIGAHFENAYFEGVSLAGANFAYANLKGAQGLTVDQLSKVKTLYKAELDEELLIPLKEKYPALFEKPDE